MFLAPRGFFSSYHPLFKTYGMVQNSSVLAVTSYCQYYALYQSLLCFLYLSAVAEFVLLRSLFFSHSPVTSANHFKGRNYDYAISAFQSLISFSETPHLKKIKDRICSSVDFYYGLVQVLIHGLAGIFINILYIHIRVLQFPCPLWVVCGLPVGRCSIQLPQDRSVQVYFNFQGNFYYQLEFDCSLIAGKRVGEFQSGKRIKSYTTSRRIGLTPTKHLRLQRGLSP